MRCFYFILRYKSASFFYNMSTYSWQTSKSHMIIELNTFAVYYPTNIQKCIEREKTQSVCCIHSSWLNRLSNLENSEFQKCHLKLRFPLRKSRHVLREWNNTLRLNRLHHIYRSPTSLWQCACVAVYVWCGGLQCKYVFVMDIIMWL